MTTRLRSTLLAMLLACCPVLAWSAPAEPVLGAAMPEAMARQVNGPVALDLPGMNRVRVVRDLPYLQGGAPEALLDIYLPRRPAKQALRPAVLLVHGSTDRRYRPKDWGFFQSWARLIAASDMVAVAFTQDLPARGPQLGAGARSVSAAILYLKSHAAQFGVDPSRLCLAVFSAGGPLLAPYLDGTDPSIRCISAYYPYLDIRGAPPFFRFEDEKALESFSPLLRLSGRQAKVPILVVRGGTDQLPGLRDSIDRFTAAALEANWPIILLNHPAGGHGFDNQLHDARTKEIIRATLDFYRSSLAPEAPGGGRQ